jgi:hypothetical protein
MEQFYGSTKAFNRKYWIFPEPAVAQPAEQLERLAAGLSAWQGHLAIILLVVVLLSSDSAPLPLVGLDLAPLRLAGSDLEPVLPEAAVLVAVGTAHHSVAD